MKAIQTRYKGYAFRSRTEARWAVFFETLGLRWEYEPEGFDLGDGVWYLPDFRVHYPGRRQEEAHAEWFEVKASLNAVSTDEWRKMALFHNATGLVVLDGVPAARTYLSVDMVFDPFSSTGRVPAAAPTVAMLGDAEKLNRHGLVLWCSKSRLWDDDPRNVFCDQSAIGAEARRELENAVNAARSYRFGAGGRA